MTEVANRDNEFVFYGSWGDGVSEAEFFGFGDALVGTKSGADFPAKSDFAEDDKIFGKFAPSDSGGNCKTNCEVGGGVLDA